MIIMAIFIILLSIRFLTVFIFQPYILIFVLLSLSFLICVVIGITYRSLLRFLLFIIYVGGVLILFMYILRVFPNESIRIRGVMLIYWIINFFFVFFALVFGYGVLIWSNIIYFSLFHYIRVKELSGLFLFMAIFLFFVIICVSYFCIKKRLPFRRLMG